MSKKTNKKTVAVESDSTYFLKLVLYVILGSLWIKFQAPVYIGDVVLYGFPLGLIIGLMFASHDHFQVDRKIEYAILILMTVVSYFLPLGIII